jgi:hypothetical protein
MRSFTDDRNQSQADDEVRQANLQRDNSHRQRWTGLLYPASIRPPADQVHFGADIWNR